MKPGIMAVQEPFCEKEAKKRAQFLWWLCVGNGRDYSSRKGHDHQAKPDIEKRFWGYQEPDHGARLHRRRLVLAKMTAVWEETGSVLQVGSWLWRPTVSCCSQEWRKSVICMRWSTFDDERDGASATAA
jgi:hypothetical protein